MTEGRLLPAKIRYHNVSSNWSKYNKPWDVIFDYPESGFTQILVKDLPTDLPIEKVEGAKNHAFKPEHKPEPTNYAHTEICTYKDGAKSQTAKLSSTVKKELRTIISDRTLVLRMPQARINP